MRLLISSYHSFQSPLSRLTIKGLSRLGCNWNSSRHCSKAIHYIGTLGSIFSRLVYIVGSRISHGRCFIITYFAKVFYGNGSRFVNLPSFLALLTISSTSMSFLGAGPKTVANGIQHYPAPSSVRMSPVSECNCPSGNFLTAPNLFIYLNSNGIGRFQGIKPNHFEVHQPIQFFCLPAASVPIQFWLHKYPSSEQSAFRPTPLTRSKDWIVAVR